MEFGMLINISKLNKDDISPKSTDSWSTQLIDTLRARHVSSYNLPSKTATHFLPYHSKQDTVDTHYNACNYKYQVQPQHKHIVIPFYLKSHLSRIKMEAQEETQKQMAHVLETHPGF